MRRWAVGRPGGFRGRLLCLYAGLLTANLLAWGWALIAFRTHPVLVGTALLAYVLGLRHAVDADHIAAIDNVTRALMQDGQRPIGVGLFFSLGHSTVVMLACAALAAASVTFAGFFATMEAFGGVAGTLVSASFLLVIACMNMVVLARLFGTATRSRAGEPCVATEADGMLAGGGILARLLRPVFGLIRRSWHMYPLGFLFGLGFDTATEVGLLGLSASQASHGLPVWSVMVFPALFTAGMALVDTTDSILMVGAYGWALVDPARKLRYNMVVTGLSVIVALTVGAIEALSLTQDRLGLKGGFWNGIASLDADAGTIGYGVTGLFLLCWAASFIASRKPAIDPAGNEGAP